MRQCSTVGALSRYTLHAQIYVEVGLLHFFFFVHHKLAYVGDVDVVEL